MNFVLHLLDDLRARFQAKVICDHWGYRKQAVLGHVNGVTRRIYVQESG